ncbi:MAG: methyltransferase domain-containing protein [Deltaproteobacteria bacterium]|nr:methyltransferase domain-containing protein [Deltaproteobacteria bacterium]
MTEPRTARSLLEVGTAAHYEDAASYDRAYRRRRHDVAYYREVARTFGGPILELGVGTGRVAIALARDGHEIVGVDRMKPMLDRARAKLAKETRATRDRIELLRGDLRTLRLRRRFPLILSPFHVLQHLYRRDDWERALATVRAHLAPRGRFVFDVLFPDPRWLCRDPYRLYRLPDVTVPETGRRVHYRESFDYDPVAQVLVIQMHFVDPAIERGRPGHHRWAPLTHRQLFPQELETLLHYNGFAIEERHGGFANEPLDDRAVQQVVVCTLRRGFRAR